jgi:hypothetical protein
MMHFHVLLAWSASEALLEEKEEARALQQPHAALAAEQQRLQAQIVDMLLRGKKRTQRAMADQVAAALRHVATAVPHRPTCAAHRCSRVPRRTDAPPTSTRGA